MLLEYNTRIVQNPVGSWQRQHINIPDILTRQE